MNFVRYPSIRDILGFEVYDEEWLKIGYEVFLVKFKRFWKTKYEVMVKIMNTGFAETNFRINQSVSAPINENLLGILERPVSLNGKTFVVFPFFDGGSVRSMIMSKFRYGIPEEIAISVQRELIKAVFSLHKNHQLHTEINSGHILMKKNNNLGAKMKLAFGATIYDESCFMDRKCFSICEWGAAPELPISGFTEKTDIWSIGVTALELAYGTMIRMEDRESMQALVSKIQMKNELPMKKKLSQGIRKQITDVGTRKFTSAFGDMVAKCLAIDPVNRPSAEILLRHRVFTKYSDGAYNQLLGNIFKDKGFSL